MKIRIDDKTHNNCSFFQGGLGFSFYLACNLLVGIHESGKDSVGITDIDVESPTIFILAVCVVNWAHHSPSLLELLPDIHTDAASPALAVNKGSDKLCKPSPVHIKMVPKINLC